MPDFGSSFFNIKLVAGQPFENYPLKTFINSVIDSLSIKIVGILITLKPGGKPPHNKTYPYVNPLRCDL